MLFVRPPTETTRTDIRTLMRLLLAGALLALVAPYSTLSAQSAQSAKPAFSLEISMPNDVVQVGSVTTVNVVLTNTSNHEIATFRLLGWGRGYEVDVRNTQGKRPRDAREVLAEKNKGAKGPIRTMIRGGSVRTVRLQPGQSMRDEINLTQMYDLSEPGKYTIQVQRTDDESKTVAKSNTIIVTVTP